MVRTIRANITQTFGPYHVRRWVRPVSQVLFSQVLSQLLGLGISLLLIRQLSKAEYATYTVLIAVQAMLDVLSSSGIHTGFQYLGGKIWQEPAKMASLIKTAVRIRRSICVIAFLVAWLYGGIILYRQALPFAHILLFLMSVTLIITPEISASFIRAALLLRSEILGVQKAQLLSQLLRLLMLSGLLLLAGAYLNIFSVLFITALSAWLSYQYLLRQSRHLLLKEASVNAVYQKTLKHYIGLTWHNAVFYAFSGQIAIFVLGTFGSTEHLAELGALSRFSLIFAGANAVISQVIAPAFGRAEKKRSLAGAFRKTSGLMLLISSLTLLLAAGFSQHLLWILGPSYGGLDYELLLVFVSALLGFLTATVHAINSARGWIRFSPALEIPVNVGMFMLAAICFDVSSLRGVLYMHMLVAAANLVLYLLNSWHGYRHYTEPVTAKPARLHNNFGT